MQLRQTYREEQKRSTVTDLATIIIQQQIYKVTAMYFECYT